MVVAVTVSSKQWPWHHGMHSPYRVHIPGCLRALHQRAIATALRPPFQCWTSRALCRCQAGPPYETRLKSTVTGCFWLPFNVGLSHVQRDCQLWDLVTSGVA